MTDLTGLGQKPGVRSAQGATSDKGDGQTRPGMPVEAYLATRSHSVLAYLLDPVRSHLDQAFRD